MCAGKIQYKLFLLCGRAHGDYVLLAMRVGKGQRAMPRYQQLWQQNIACAPP
jgi:hypothetical protein